MKKSYITENPISQLNFSIRFLFIYKNIYNKFTILSGLIKNSSTKSIGYSLMLSFALLNSSRLHSQAIFFFFFFNQGHSPVEM